MSKPYVIKAPRTPGANPSWIGEYATLDEAQAAAERFCRGRLDLHGQDVRIETQDGERVRYAGTGS